MIVPMMHLDLVCVADERRLAMERLRELGVVHLELSSVSGAAVDEARKDAADASRAVRLICKARESAVAAEDAALRRMDAGEVLALAADRERLAEESTRLSSEIRR